MKRILVYMLLLGCFACSDEVLLDSEEVVRVKSGDMTENSLYQLIVKKFVFIQWSYAYNLKALTKFEQNNFIYETLTVFSENLALNQMLKDFRGTVSVAMDPKLPPTEDARYDPGERVTRFKKIDTRPILHEFFHNFQHQQLGYSMDKNAKGMIEFEAYMAMDIVHTIEYRKVPSHLEVQVGENQGAYRAMLTAFALTGDFDIKAWEQNFCKWAKTWDHPDAKNMSDNYFVPQLIISVFRAYLYAKAQRQL